MVLDAPGRAVFDSGAPGGPGHLVILVGGPAARALSDVAPAERQRRLLEDLVQQLGDAVLRPASWHEKAWHLDEHAGGGYMALTRPGAPSELPFPHAPVGHIHWAGTETAQDHPGYLDGAIEAGLRAAGEIRALL
jgi:monoamine oxidase